jgi:transketolase
MNLRMESTRVAYGKALVELADKYDFVVMDADLSKATCTHEFAKKYPYRFFNMGIAEGDMMATAAGFASCGIPVFASTFAIFASGRAYEQVRQTIGYTGLNVKIGATHGGVLIGEDGGSHQCIEDISLMRGIPGMTVLVPADAVSARILTENALKMKGPVYLRFGRHPSEIIYDDAESFAIGKSKTLLEGTDATVIAIGDMVYQALIAAKELKSEGYSIRVIDSYSIKPLDESAIIRAAVETGAIVTAEDHNIIGGLGSSVSEIICENHPVIMKRIGIMDRFGVSGKPDELKIEFGLNSTMIKNALIELIKKK